MQFSDSKEIAIFAITVILQQSLKATGIDFPLTPEQIYAAGIGSYGYRAGVLDRRKDN